MTNYYSTHEGNPDEAAILGMATTAGSPEHQSLMSGLSIWAKVGVQLGQKVEELAKANRVLMARLQRNTPVTYKMVGSTVYSNAAGALNVISLGGPDVGTFWEINNFAIGGTDINVTAAGSFGLYVSGYQGTVSPGLGALVDGAAAGVGGVAAMPFTETYGTRQIVVTSQEQIYAIIYGGTNNLNYVATIQASVYNVAAAMGSVDTIA